MNYENLERPFVRFVTDEVLQYSNEIKRRSALTNFWSLSLEIQFYFISYLILAINRWTKSVGECNHNCENETDIAVIPCLDRVEFE